MTAITEIADLLRLRKPTTLEPLNKYNSQAEEMENMLKIVLQRLINPTTFMTLRTKIFFGQKEFNIRVGLT